MHGTSDQGWFYVYLCVGWFGHMCHGMAMAILGPAQPYLAQNVGVLNEQINFIWTGRGVGSCLAAIMTGLVFKSLLRKRWQKLVFLGSFILCEVCLLVLCRGSLLLKYWCQVLNSFEDLALHSFSSIADRGLLKFLLPCRKFCLYCVHVGAREISTVHAGV